MFLLLQRLGGIITSIVIRVKHRPADHIDAISFLRVSLQKGAVEVAPYYWNKMGVSEGSREQGAMLSCEITQRPYSKSAFVIITDKAKCGFSLSVRPKTHCSALTFGQKRQTLNSTLFWASLTICIPDYMPHHEHKETRQVIQIYC